MARVDEIQLEQWRLENREVNRKFIERPSAVGDRSDPQRVAAYEEKSRKSASASFEMFRVELLAVLGDIRRVDEYIKLEEKLVIVAGREARRKSDALLGISNSKDD
jgi:hypothetical protein